MFVTGARAPGLGLSRGGAPSSHVAPFSLPCPPCLPPPQDYAAAIAACQAGLKLDASLGSLKETLEAATKALKETEVGRRAACGGGSQCALGSVTAWIRVL